MTTKKQGRQRDVGNLQPYDYFCMSRNRLFIGRFRVRPTNYHPGNPEISSPHLKSAIAQHGQKVRKTQRSLCSGSLSRQCTARDWRPKFKGFAVSHQGRGEWTPLSASKAQGPEAENMWRQPCPFAVLSLRIA